jgi:hypothetical protein
VLPTCVPLFPSVTNGKKEKNGRKKVKKQENVLKIYFIKLHILDKIKIKKK